MKCKACREAGELEAKTRSLYSDRRDAIQDKNIAGVANSTSQISNIVSTAHHLRTHHCTCDKGEGE